MPETVQLLLLLPVLLMGTVCLLSQLYMDDCGMRALCNSLVIEMQLICYKVAANMSFLSDTALSQPSSPPSLGALAIDMHKFLKRLSMPQESGSSSFQHLNKVGSPALPEQKPLRGFVLSSFPPFLLLLLLFLLHCRPVGLFQICWTTFSSLASHSRFLGHRRRRININCIVSKKFFQSGLRLTEKVVKVLFSPLVYCVISFARL